MEEREREKGVGKVNELINEWERTASTYSSTLRLIVKFGELSYVADPYLATFLIKEEFV